MPQALAAPPRYGWWWAFTLGLTAVFLVVALPDLGRYPRTHADETWVMSAAYKLARTGVFGSDMFSGFAGADQHYFIALPVHHVLVALSFMLFGSGIAQARLVSVLGAVIVLWSATWLSLRWHGLLASCLTGTLLAVLRADLVDLWPGLPLLAVGRSARYDMTAVAFFWLAIVFFDLAIQWSSPRRQWAAYATGVCAGLATLTQFFGAFIVADIAIMLLWIRVDRFPVRGIAARISVGWAVVVLPYLAYVADHWSSFRGQSALKEGRTDFLNPWFYLDNLRDEPARYQPLIEPAHIVDAGLASLFFAFAIWPALGWLAWKSRKRERVGDRLLLTTLLVCAGALALADSTNVPLYTIILWPGCCVAIAGLTASSIEWARLHLQSSRAALPRAVIAAACVSSLAVSLTILADGAEALREDRHQARTTSDYADVARRLDAELPAGVGVVGHPRWWWGLRDHGYLALNVLELQWRDRDDGTGLLSFAELFDASGARVLIVDDNARSEIARYPADLRESVEMFLATDVERIAVVTDPTYGRFEIYLRR